MDLENQIKEAERRMRELQNEIKTEAHASETSEDMEVKALNESKLFLIFNILLWVYF